VQTEAGVVGSVTIFESMEMMISSTALIVYVDDIVVIGNDDDI
jgi:hypothetical protein